MAAQELFADLIGQVKLESVSVSAETFIDKADLPGLLRIEINGYPRDRQTPRIKIAKYVATR